MWPWAHAAVGYLLYSLSHHRRDADPPSDAAALAVVFGTLAPDLVDKTLAWYLGVLPGGRTLTHSLVVLVPVSVALLAVLRRRGHGEVGLALVVGLLSHPLADGLHSALTGAWGDLTFLLWPLLELPPYEGPRSVVDRLVALELTPFVAFQALLTLAALAVWARQGYPGVGRLRSWGRAAVS